MRRVLRYLGEFTEELILIALIILNILQFLEIITPDWDYAEKIVSWTALGYLFYRASLTRIFFGQRNRQDDFLIVAAYFFLTAKNVITNSITAITELAAQGVSSWATLIPVEQGFTPPSVHVAATVQNVSLESLSNIPVGGALDHMVSNFTIMPGFPPKVNEIFINVSNDMSSRIFLIEPKFLSHRWHNLLIDHALFLEKIGIVAGMLILMYVAFRYATKLRIAQPSLMHVIKEEGVPPASYAKRLSRFLIIFALLNFFFLAVFNLTIEWLGVAVDDSLIVLAVFFYLLLWLKYHNNFDPESLIFKIGNVGEEFYESFVKLFHSSAGILLGVSGMLVLHLLTDIGIFILPYITGLSESIYLAGNEAMHRPLIGLIGHTGLLFSDMNQVLGMADKISIAILYALNIIGISMLMLAPAYIWYLLFSKRPMEVPAWVIALFYAGLLTLVLAPAFSLGRMSSDLLVGVDITTQSILDTLIFQPSLPVIAALVAGAAVILLSMSQYLKDKLITGAMVTSIAGFGIYAYLFLMDTSSYFVRSILQNIHAGQIIIASYMLVLFSMTLVFYVGGYFMYVYEIYRS
jgi:hypothetical protein